MKILFENLGHTNSAPDVVAANPQGDGMESHTADANSFEESLRRFLAENGELETIEELTEAMQRWLALELPLEHPE